MEKGKKLTLEALLAKKEQREAAKYEISQVNIPSLGGYLQLEKIRPIRSVSPQTLCVLSWMTTWGISI